MIANVIREIGGIANFGVISICLFFTVFTVALIRALLLKKSFVRDMSVIPLQDGDVHSRKSAVVTSPSDNVTQTSSLLYRRPPVCSSTHE